MILINKGTSSTVALSLNEKMIGTNSNILFKFTNDVSNNTKIFVSTDLHDTTRYNEFVITDSVTELPYGGQMNFLPTGFWTYIVYEMPYVIGTPSLSPTYSLGILEQGKVMVVGDDVVVPSFNMEGDDITPSFDMGY